MILIVSGRTDIVAFYTKWFINRYHAGFVDVRNPYNPSLINRIYFKDVDAILFCTKNPTPILPFIDQIKIPMLFHVTITPYHQDIEPNVLSKEKIIEGVKELSKKIGKENVYIRYDPVFINDRYTIDYHIKAFSRLCTLCENYIAGFIISFLDNYKNVQKNYHILHPHIWTEDMYKKIGLNFSKIALKHHLYIKTCAEKENLSKYGFIKGECLSQELAERLTGKSKFKKWNARKNKNCNCVEMVDIAAYNTCPHLCVYCYANYAEEKIKENIKNHDETSSVLIGHVKEDEKIIIRR